MSVRKSLPLSEFEYVENDELKMQLGLGLTLFLPRPFDVARAGVRQMWQTYLRIVGKERLTWARLGGGNRSRKISAPVFKTIDEWLGGSKDYGETCWISIHDGAFDSLGSTGFYLEGYGEVQEGDNSVGFVEVYLPLSILDTADSRTLAKLFIELAEPVRSLCGIGGYIFHRSPYAYSSVVGRMAALSRRFQGVEVMGNHRAAYWAGRGVPSVNWITFIGDEYVARLGGTRALKQKLPPQAYVHVLDNGLAIQAGDSPTVGDANRPEPGLEIWREVYRALKPVMFYSPTAKFDSRFFDHERTIEWLQRLDRDD
jgi:hypothetical protein